MKLCDFGLSLPSQASHGVGGTLPYMAPEIVALEDASDNDVSSASAESASAAANPAIDM